MKHLLILAILLIIAACILYALNVTNGAPNRIKNGFVRNYAAKNFTIAKEVDFKVQLNALCGTKGDTLYFIGRNPAKIYVTTGSFAKFDTLTLQLPEIKNLAPVFSTTVIYPNAYIIGGNARMLIKANLISGKADTLKLRLGGVISRSVAVSPNTFIAEVIEDSTHNVVFKVFDGKGNIVKTETNLMPKLADAGFTNAGTLSYDASTGHLAHVTYYLNRLNVFDTTLNSLYAVNTLDTNATTKFELKKNEKNITHKSPPVMVNTFSTQHGGNIYVKSKLEADNETSNFATSSVIDQFDSKGNYIQSFYLPDGKNERLRNFYVTDTEKVIGINNNKLTVYSLNNNNKILK